MSDFYTPSRLNLQGSLNITKRKVSGRLGSKMAAPGKAIEFGDAGQTFIDSILSREETEDVLSMLLGADESLDGLQLPSFCTSSQMAGKNPLRRPTTPPLSPLFSCTPNEEADGKNLVDGPELITGNSKEADLFYSDQVMNQMDINSSFADARSGTDGKGPLFSATLDPGTIEDSINSTKPAGGAVPDGPRVSGPDPVFATVNKAVAEHVAMGNNVTTGDGGQVAAGNVVGTSVTQGSDVLGQSIMRPSGTRENSGDDGLEPDDGDNRSSVSDSPSIEFGEGRLSRIDTMFEKMSMVEDILSMISERSTNLGGTVRELTASLEFSQQEIVALKQENEEMKKKLEAVVLEDKKTQFQVEAVEDKVDRLETSSKRNNLIVEGLPEPDGRREDVEKTIGQLFDQLSVNKGVNFEACYRMGSYTKGKPRPIFLSFEKMADRNLLYAKRMDLRHTADYQRVWINEDLGPISKRKRGIIRLIAKEAALQGIDCRTGKYAVHIDNVKYDHNNLTDLPPRLQPTHLKQVLVNQRTLAYQSEHAPLSNFFPAQVKIGQLVFFCAEQAFQFIRAKTVNKNLIATKIYLTRDVHVVKQLGNELGTSKEWEDKQFEVMYTCLKKKFVQNQDLQDLLLKTGDLELVEATPNLLWGCGATLSSNVIRRGEWRGRNKHGEILMVVREELRQRRLKKAGDTPQ